MIIDSSEFSVPPEFADYSSALFAKESITEREFVDFCVLAVKLAKSHWDTRQGLAYHVAGAWLNYKNIGQDHLLDEIGAAFGRLELPDKHVAPSEEVVRNEWSKVEYLVVEADRQFANTSKV